MIEAGVRWTTDSGLAADGVKALAREARKLAAKVVEKRAAVRDLSRSSAEPKGGRGVRRPSRA